MKANSLFILFYFPPFARVGGRRWAKYLKYLYRQNHNFKVLAGDYKTTSPWDKDITEYESRIIWRGVGRLRLEAFIGSVGLVTADCH